MILVAPFQCRIFCKGNIWLMYCENFSITYLTISRKILALQTSSGTLGLSHNSRSILLMKLSLLMRTDLFSSICALSSVGLFSGTKSCVVFLWHVLELVGIGLPGLPRNYFLHLKSELEIGSNDERQKPLEDYIGNYHLCFWAHNPN